MLEIAGILFGGVSRLAQFFMELKDKALERDHEFRMYEQQIKLNDQKFAAEKELRQIDARTEISGQEFNAIEAALTAQAKEVEVAGGWVAKLSATVRPFITYWLIAIYSIHKVASIVILMSYEGASLAENLNSLYGDFDAALLGSVVGYWFADRSIRKNAT